MRKTLKWVALFVVMLPVHLIVVLAVTGVPRPPAITAEGVGRVAWGPVWTMPPDSGSPGSERSARARG